MIKVLLAEDEEHIQMIAKMALELSSEYEVETCSNGVELLERYDSFSPDLILLDVMMPRMDGPAAMKELISTHPEGISPVIFMTAKVQSKEKNSFIELGAIGVISKPFDPISLPDEVRTLLSSCEDKKL